MMRSYIAASLVALLISGCCGRGRLVAQGPGPVDDPVAAPPVDPVGGDVEAPPVDPGDPALAARIAFANAGGKWMPQQLADQAELLRGLGLRVEAAALADPTAAPLGAIVNIGGCTGSFVSRDGLIITNHHCVQRELQMHSSEGHNLLQDGFLAATRADEKYLGPAKRVLVTQGFRNITSDLLAGLEAIVGDEARALELERREKQQLADCEAGRDGVVCAVEGFFRGAEYWLIEYLELRDVRLVHAPAKGIGNYGGDVDNWMWPRHTGDYSFLRAYAGKDGMPADFAEDNEPFHPAHVLAISTKGVKAHDLMLLPGFPGKTYRLATGAETAAVIDWELPRDIAKRSEVAAALEAVAQLGEEVAIKAAPRIQGNANYYKKHQGVLDGLTRGGVAAKKQADEDALRGWIATAGHPAEWAAGLAGLDALAVEKEKTREHDANLDELLKASALLEAALTIVRMAEERPKADLDRDKAYQAREWERLEAKQQQFLRSYSAPIDRALLALAIERTARDWSANRDVLVDLFGAVVGEKLATAPDAKTIGEMLDKAYRRTALEPEAERLKLFGGATTRQLAKSKDPFIRMAMRLRPYQKELEQQARVIKGKQALLAPAYIAALRGFENGLVAPDANSTLRVSYGTIHGYRREAGADELFPFTRASEIATKATGTPPFDAPRALLDLIAAKRWGGYADADLGEVPVAFLSDVDITNGNSGSPTLDARGELVGLAFDGTLESVAGDYMFLPDLQRTIHVDIRYVLWVMDGVYGADALLEEMGITPSVP